MTHGPLTMAAQDRAEPLANPARPSVRGNVMRRPMAAVVCSAVLAVSMLMVWTVTIEWSDAWLVSAPGDGIAVAAADAEDLLDCLDDPTEPAFVACTLADGTTLDGFWTGEAFIRSKVLFEAINSRFGGHGMEISGIAVLLYSLLRQNANGPYVLALLLLLGTFGEVATVEGIAVPPPPAAPPPREGPEQPPSAVEGKPVAPEEPVGAQGPPAAVEEVPNWRLLIELGATSVSFDGQITGDPSGWRYEGKSVRSTPGSWHQCHGPADVSCTFAGDPEDPERPNIEMRCTVRWKRVTEDIPATWETLTDAQFQQYWHNTGEFKGWTYAGWTRTYKEDGTYTSDYPSVTLRGDSKRDVADVKDCG